MFWLIWIVMMLLAPVLAGVRVWLQMRKQPSDAPNEQPQTTTQENVAAPNAL